MEEMYDVLRFIEHSGNCRQSMDCIQGTLLIRYLKDNPSLEKSVLFGWFRQLGVCIDQYHRCRNYKDYRYLNPYSVVVTQERELVLLDLEAPDNAFVMKQMQKRAVRNHFVKPVCEMGVERGNKADLFAYGKTIQFVLAYAQITPELTHWEEIRLSRMISRCMGETGKAYEDIRQAVQAIPVIKANTRNPSGRRKWILAAGACACVALCAVLLPGQSSTSAGDAVGEVQGSEVHPDSESRVSGSADLGEDVTEQREMTDEEILERAGEILDEYARSNVLKDRYLAVTLGRELEQKCVRCLAAVYEETGREEEAIEAYERLVQIEDNWEDLEAAREKAAELSGGEEEE